MRSKEERAAAKRAVQWKPGQSGNPGGRARGLERMTRDEIAAMTWTEMAEDGTETVYQGWQALRRRLFLIGMYSEPREAIAAIKLLHERGYGSPKQEVVFEDKTPAEQEIDWSQVSLERRRQLLESALEIGALAGESNTEH
jgi:hypothetical protein